MEAGARPQGTYAREGAAWCAPGATKGRPGGAGERGRSSMQRGERGRLAGRAGAQPRAPAATATFNYGGTATDRRGNEGNGSGAHEGRRRTRPAWRRSSGEVDRARGSDDRWQGRHVDPVGEVPPSSRWWSERTRRTTARLLARS